MQFGRFLNKDGAVRRTSAEISSEKAKQSCSAAASAEVRLDRHLQAWWDNPSWTDEPPEIKVSTLIAAEHFYGLLLYRCFSAKLTPNQNTLNVLGRPIDFRRVSFS